MTIASCGVFGCARPARWALKSLGGDLPGLVCSDHLMLLRESAFARWTVTQQYELLQSPLRESRDE